MANLGSVLSTSQYLTPADYLASPNNLFFAIIQGDGNFCVYHGPGPTDNMGYLWCQGTTGSAGEYFAIMQADGNFVVYAGTGPTDNQGLLWSSSSTSSSEGSYFAILQDDGNFCVYRGTGPSDNQGLVWNSGVTDPIENIDIASIDYDVANATIEDSVPQGIYSQDVQNNSAETQNSSIQSTQGVNETSGWSDSLSVDVGFKATYKTGVPIVAETSVEMSASVTTTFTWNGSTTRTNNWGFNVTASVNAGCEIKVLVSVTLSTISVPYVLTGTGTFKSGISMPVTINGTYNGSNSHDLLVTYENVATPTCMPVTVTSSSSATSSVNGTQTVNTASSSTSATDSTSESTGRLRS